MKLSSDAANTYLKTNPDSPITNSVSTAMEAAGNLQTNALGGVAFVNTYNPDFNVANTSLHEFKHTIEQIAEAETKAGKTGTV